MKNIHVIMYTKKSNTYMSEVCPTIRKLLKQGALETF